MSRLRQLFFGALLLSVFAAGCGAHYVHSWFSLSQFKGALSEVQDDGTYAFTEAQGEVTIIVALPRSMTGKNGEEENDRLARSFLTRGEWKRIHRKSITDKEWYGHGVYVYKPVAGKKAASDGR